MTNQPVLVWWLLIGCGVLLGFLTLVVQALAGIGGTVGGAVERLGYNRLGIVPPPRPRFEGWGFYVVYALALALIGYGVWNLL